MVGARVEFDFAEEEGELIFHAVDVADDDEAVGRGGVVFFPDGGQELRMEC